MDVELRRWTQKLRSKRVRSQSFFSAWPLLPILELRSGRVSEMSYGNYVVKQVQVRTNINMHFVDTSVHI